MTQYKLRDWPAGEMTYRVAMPEEEAAKLEREIAKGLKERYGKMACCITVRVEVTVDTLEPPPDKK